MEYQELGRTGLNVSVIGFGGWAIGGGARIGDVPIGWGNAEDKVSLAALDMAWECGINFIDTADFYGLGHSEEVIGKWIRQSGHVPVIATKVGHVVTPEGRIGKDYSYPYIIRAAETSLKRLQVDTIDLYQLHSAKREDLERGECLDALNELKRQGKIRFSGVSLDTRNPEPEAELLIADHRVDCLQVVYSLINQRAARSVIPAARQAGMGAIARMVLHFGLLTGKFTDGSRFSNDDHRSMRLDPEQLHRLRSRMAELEPLRNSYGGSWSELALQFSLQCPGISTAIVGIRDPRQAAQNAAAASASPLPESLRQELAHQAEILFDSLIDHFK